LVQTDLLGMLSRMSIPPFSLQELILERASDPATADKVMARMDDRTISYASYARQAIAWAHLFRARSHGSAPRVAVMMQNNLEFLLAYGGVAFSGGTLFGLNTGLGGHVLRRVIEASGAQLILVDSAHQAAVEAVTPPAPVLCVGAHGQLDAELARVAAALDARLDEPPELQGVDATTPLAVIYTSGTTGLPKGVINSHGKLRGIGMAISSRVGLRPDDVGYISMPLFHSNALFLNWLPAMQVGAGVALREKFTASGFFDDLVRYGASYWNYVGQPVHYVLEAISRACGGDLERIRRELREHPGNRLRLALGTGASGRDRRRFIDWLGLEHVFEGYGSTEAEIHSWCMPGDPIDSVGQLEDDAVAIIDQRGRECPPLEIDSQDRFVNAQAAVGEIVRRGTGGLFQGYHAMPDASRLKVEDGIYRSGDLGAVRRLGPKRYLYFFGRTDDWIRKDGENFSAQSVVELAEAWAAVDRAAAFGVPHPVSDEWVMVALRMKQGQSFDPDAFFAHCQAQLAGGCDPKWFPDFVRVVEAFEWTETIKIKVRGLKAAHYDPERAERIFRRRRGDTTFRPFGASDYEELCREFDAQGRRHVLAS
jgi:fatty-acyl-CoA synthase